MLNRLIHTIKNNTKQPSRTPHNSRIIILLTSQRVNLLTTLDMSDNFLRDLQSDVFVSLPNLTQLNLSYSNLSTLTVSVAAQLANVRNAVDLQGNPWMCDCLMYSTTYCLRYSGET